MTREKILPMMLRREPPTVVGGAAINLIHVEGHNDVVRMLCGMYPFSQQRQRSSCRCCSNAGFPLFRTSGGMTYFPSAFLQVRWSLTLWTGYLAPP